MDQNADGLLLKAIRMSGNAAKSLQLRDNAKAALEKAKTAIDGQSARNAAEEVCNYLLSRDRAAEIGEPLSAPMPELSCLAKTGAIRSAEYVWDQLGDSLKQIEDDDLIQNAPTPRVLVRIAKTKKSILDRAILRLHSEGSLAASSAALDWVVESAKPKQLIPLASLLSSDLHRDAHRPIAAHLLKRALSRDKTGAFLRSVLEHAQTDASGESRLSDAISKEPAVATQFIRLLPKLLSGKTADVSMRIFRQWTPLYPSTPQKLREQLSSALAQLIAYLLKRRKRNSQENEVLSTISKFASSWLLAMKQTGDSQMFWIVAPATELVGSLTESERVSTYGAGLIANSIDKARRGASIESLLDALALNVGMEPIGVLHDRVQFDATIHEDTVGGILKGDVVEIVEQGWRLGGTLIRRAKVKGT